MEQRWKRISEAHRMGLRNRVREEWHLAEERADALIEIWRGKAIRLGMAPGAPGYWSHAQDWIWAQLGGSDPLGREMGRLG